MRALNRVFKGRARGDQPTLPAKVKRILRKYPSMLHIAGPAVPILGPELVSNGAFDTADGWSAATGWGIAADALNHTAPSTLIPALAVATQAGKTYQCAYSITSQSAAGSGVSLRLGSTNLTIRNAVGTYSETLAQTVDSTIVGFIARGGSGDWLGSIDNLSVREIVGYQNTYASFAAGNYKESTGNTLAGVDQQVGRVLDASKTAGPELTAGNAWSSAAGIAAVGTEIHFSGATGGASLNAGLAVPGSLHEVTYEIYDYVSGGVKPFLGATAAAALGNSNGWRTELVVADDNQIRVFVSSSPATLKVRNISVRELPGTHAAQATSGYQTFLRQVPKTLGPELVVNGGFDSGANWNVPAGFSVSAGLLNVADGAVGGQTYQHVPTGAGKSYLVTGNTSASVGAVRVDWRFGLAGNGVTSGNVSFIGVATGATSAVSVVRATSATTATADNISVREVLEWTYAWQFDGVDDRLPLTSLPLSSGDDFYQAFALRCATSGANKTFADLLTNPTTGTRLGCLRINGSNALQVVHANDAGGVVTTAGRTVTDGQQLVVEALRVGASHTVFADGAVDIQTALAGNYTTTHATIGARGAGTSEPFLGFLYASFALKGAPSDGERATIRRFLAQLQGRSL